MHDMSAYFVGHLLKGRRFLVTGATGGAGSRTAMEISRVGGMCSLVAPDPTKGEQVLRELHGSGHTMLNHFVDGELQLEASGPFDGIFHAAGIEHVGALKDAWHSEAAVFHPSLRMALTLMKGVGGKPSLLKDGGSIVLMSSVAAVRGQTGMSLYCASKAAIEGLTRAAAVELASRRIRVNCIRAGGFDSPMHRRILQRATPQQIDTYADKHLFGFGKSEDIAHAALYLLSDAARWVTGTSMVVDGGFSAR